MADHRQASQVADMLGAMRVRGPDQDGVRTEGPAALGCCRLAILDVRDGSQPMSTPDGRFTIVYNGECYELDRLRQWLRGAGVVLRTRTDTELILHAFARLGPACLDRLNGMFALAIWDRDCRQLFLARDRFGIKPLYYALLDGRLLFASTLDGLAAVEDFPRELDPVAVDHYLATRFIPAPRTIYRRACKLPAGHLAVLRGDCFRTAAWWDLPRQVASVEVPEGAAAVGRVGQLLEQATRCRLASERPVGICLSGGLDSGLLASCLRGTGVPAFSLFAGQGTYDESNSAARTAEFLQLPHHRILGDGDPDRLFCSVVDHLDEPMADSSALAMLALSQGIRGHATVILSGSGADELFGGYRRQDKPPCGSRAGCAARRAAGPRCGPWPERRPPAAGHRWLGSPSPAGATRCPC